MADPPSPDHNVNKIHQFITGLISPSHYLFNFYITGLQKARICLELKLLPVAARQLTVCAVTLLIGAGARL